MHLTAKVISFIAIAIQCASFASAQTTCWNAGGCPGASFDNQNALIAFGSAFCGANALNPSGTGFSTSGLASAIFANGPYNSTGDCTTAFTTIITTCLGKVNGGTFINLQSTGNPSSTTSTTSTSAPAPTVSQLNNPRLVVSFGNCEIV